MKPIRLIEDPFPLSDRTALAKWLTTGDPRLTQGPLVRQFEEAFAKWLDRSYCVFVNSGSSANLLAYAVLRETRESALENRNYVERDIVVPAVAWPTTIAPLLQLGFKIKLVDASPKTWGIARGVDADVLVDVLGVPSQRQKNAFLVDACGAHGSQFQGRKVGSSGDGMMSTFSFYSGHAMNTIEGGMVCTDDRDTYCLLLALRAHGWAVDLPSKTAAEWFRYKSRDASPFRERFTFYVPGFNVRGTDLQAFLGLRQLKRLDAAVEKRIENGTYYRELLQDAGFEVQEPLDGDVAAPIGIGVLADSRNERGVISDALKANDIEVRPVGGGNMARQPFLKNHSRLLDFPVADAIHDRGFQLPCHPLLTKKDIQRVVHVVEMVRK